MLARLINAIKSFVSDDYTHIGQYERELLDNGFSEEDITELTEEARELGLVIKVDPIRRNEACEMKIRGLF